MISNASPRSQWSKVYFAWRSDGEETNIKLLWYVNNVLGRPEKKKSSRGLAREYVTDRVCRSLTGLSCSQADSNLPVAGAASRGPLITIARPRAIWTERSHCHAQQRWKKEIDREGPDTIAAFIANLFWAVGIVRATADTGRNPADLQKHDSVESQDEVSPGFGRLWHESAARITPDAPTFITIRQGLHSAMRRFSASIISERL